jgi:hypothetical protein
MSSSDRGRHQPEPPQQFVPISSSQNLHFSSKRSGPGKPQIYSHNKSKKIALVCGTCTEKVFVYSRGDICGKKFLEFQYTGKVFIIKNLYVLQYIKYYINNALAAWHSGRRVLLQT